MKVFDEAQKYIINLKDSDAYKRFINFINKYLFNDAVRLVKRLNADLFYCKVM